MPSFSHSSSAHHLVSKTGGYVNFNDGKRDLYLVSLSGIAHFNDLTSTVPIGFKLDVGSALARTDILLIPSHHAIYRVKDYALHLGLCEIEDQGNAHDSVHGAVEYSLNLGREEHTDKDHGEITDNIIVGVQFYVGGSGAKIRSVSYKIDMLMYWTGLYSRDF